MKTAELEVSQPAGKGFGLASADKPKPPERPKKPPDEPKFFRNWM
jgi:hypothetical protein